MCVYDYSIPLSDFHLSNRRKSPIIITTSDTDSSGDENIIDPKSKMSKTIRIIKEKIVWPQEKSYYKKKRTSSSLVVRILLDFIRVLGLRNFLNYLFTIKLIELITKLSNLNSIQANVNKPANITQVEIEQFIAIVITSLVRLPATRIY